MYIKCFLCMQIQCYNFQCSCVYQICILTNRYFSAVWSGRGFQLKNGVEGATGDFLLFLHSDTNLPPNFDVAAESCLERPGNVAGSFAWSVDSDRFVCLLCLNVAHLCGMRFSIGLFVSAYVCLFCCDGKRSGGYMETTTCCLNSDRLVCLCCKRKRREEGVDWLLILKLLDLP